jgi:hypothetical protein
MAYQVISTHQPRSNQVPTIQLELKKLENLSFDDEGKTQPNGRTMLPHAFKPTNNVSRETFNYIKDNPGLTRSQVGKGMEDKGFKKGSVISLATQFLRQNMVRTTNGGLFVMQDNYTPLKAPKAKKPSTDVLPKPQKKVAKVTASPAQTIYISGANTQSAQELLASMSIVQARSVYDELKKIFGS